MKFHKNPSSWWRVVSCGQTDRRTDMTKLTVAFSQILRKRLKFTRRLSAIRRRVRNLLNKQFFLVLHIWYHFHTLFHSSVKLTPTLGIVAMFIYIYNSIQYFVTICIYVDLCIYSISPKPKTNRQQTKT
jgi:hypothetical protein